MSDEWTDKIIQEMERASGEADGTRLGQTARDNSASAVMQKYFKPGATRGEAERLLRELKGNGYDIGEYRYEGVRSWPDDPFRPYLDEEVKRHYQDRIPKGISKFVVTKNYGRARLIVVKNVKISFRMNDGENRIFDVKASLFRSAIQE